MQALALQERRLCRLWMSKRKPKPLCPVWRHDWKLRKQVSTILAPMKAEIAARVSVPAPRLAGWRAVNLPQMPAIEPKRLQIPSAEFATADWHFVARDATQRRPVRWLPAVSAEWQNQDYAERVAAAGLPQNYFWKMAMVARPMPAPVVRALKLMAPLKAQDSPHHWPGAWHALPAPARTQAHRPIGRFAGHSAAARRQDCLD